MEASDLPAHCDTDEMEKDARPEGKEVSGWTMSDRTGPQQMTSLLNSILPEADSSARRRNGWIFQIGSGGLTC